MSTDQQPPQSDNLPQPAAGFTWIPKTAGHSLSTWELVDEDGALEFTNQLATTISNDDTSQAAPVALTGADDDIPDWIAHQARRASEARMTLREKYAEDQSTRYPDLYGNSRADAAVAVQHGMVHEPTAADPAGGFSNWTFQNADLGVGVFALVSIIITFTLLSVDSLLAVPPALLICVLGLVPAMMRYDAFYQAANEGPQVTDDSQLPHRRFTGGRHQQLAELMHKVHHATATTDHGGVDDPLWDMWETLTSLVDEATGVPDNASRARYDTACSEIVAEIRTVLDSRGTELSTAPRSINDPGDPDRILAELEAATAEIPAPPTSQAELQNYLNRITHQLRASVQTPTEGDPQ